MPCEARGDFPRQANARAARREVEDVIDARGGEWTRGLSMLIDFWISVAEAAA
jgi:hypothetical protein